MKTIIGILVVIIFGVAAYFTLSNHQVTPVVNPTPINSTSTPSASIPKVRSATSAEVNAYVLGSNQFGFDLYSRYSATQVGKNIFFSPYSITTALGMTYEGAKGQTAAEMQNVLHIPTDVNSRQSAVLSVYNSLNASGQPFTLKTANALWVEKTYNLLPDFLSIAQTFYNGVATNLDFKNAPEPSRVTINSWVANQTNNKITNLLGQGTIDTMTRLVLTNAVYFKGTWVTPFDKTLTKPTDFHVTDSQTVSTLMMTLTGEKADFSYGETDSSQLLSMPYNGDRLSMLIILPKSGSLSSVESSLNATSIKSLEQSMSKQRIDVYIPKFTFKTTYGLASDLIAMGMPTAFLPSAADFSGMSGNKDLYIGAVIHQAYVAVDEEGTEAAAATAVVMTATAVMEPKPIPVFRADHPFVFFITDNTTGEILFMGRVMDPTE